MRRDAPRCADAPARPRGRSAAPVLAMRLRTRGVPNLRWAVADARRLRSIADGSVDLIVDKGALAAVAVGSGAAHTDCLREARRVLRAGGVLLSYMLGPPSAPPPLARAPGCEMQSEMQSEAPDATPSGPQSGECVSASSGVAHVAEIEAARHVAGLQIESVHAVPSADGAEHVLCYVARKTRGVAPLPVAQGALVPLERPV